jgi:single-strand selective monofunctional uracil DNA glycosylase
LTTRGIASIVDDLSAAVSALEFSPPVDCVYNPLDYAREPHLAYLERYASSPKEVVMLGMNPGPWGMAQTGVPFGEIALVREWLGIEERVSRPAQEHPKRPILGFECARSEVSGRRLWGWARDRFGTPEAFFSRFTVANYCPLAFMAESGRNLTPDRLPAVDREPLFAVCDEALRRTMEILQPEWLVGIGRFAETRARKALEGLEISIGRALHPSPASPAANRGWAEQFERDLRGLGIEV